MENIKKNEEKTRSKTINYMNLVDSFIKNNNEKRIEKRKFMNNDKINKKENVLQTNSGGGMKKKKRLSLMFDIDDKSPFKLDTLENKLRTTKFKSSPGI